MRIAIIGKFPPIQGGVSMRTYWTAHALAGRGHEVHVVTNAKEAQPPFRMHMRAEDWKRCETSSGVGSVTVHWTDPVDRSQAYIPMASPFVSKLATVAAGVHSENPLDIIFSHYMEPYGVAGYLTSQMTGVPHVVRMAGSDAGRLWHHPQLEALYDHVLRSAQAVVVTGAVAERAIARGIDPGRVTAGGSYALSEDLFTPDGPVLDFARLKNEIEADEGLRGSLWGGFADDRPHFGIYGKLGENKGSFALLAALHRLKLAGLDVGLVALAHGRPEIERRFRERVKELGLTDRILQIPFLPHWRVPEFLRGCLAVCCLEQNFPIGFHSPITPFEVLLCGRCLVGSTEVIRKLPQWQRLPHSYGCVAVENVNDIDELSGRLAAIIRDSRPAAIVGARGRRFALDVQRDADFPRKLQQILEDAAARKPPGKAAPDLPSVDAIAEDDRFRLTRLAAACLSEMSRDNSTRQLCKSIDLEDAQRLLTKIERQAAQDEPNLRPLARAIAIEVAIGSAEAEAGGPDGADEIDPLYRLNVASWALGEEEIATLVPRRSHHLRVLHFDHDISAYQTAQTVADFPSVGASSPSYLVVFGRDAQRDPLLVDGLTASFLELCDGSKTVSEIFEVLRYKPGVSRPSHGQDWIEDLFIWGLISLHSRSLGT